MRTVGSPEYSRPGDIREDSMLTASLPKRLSGLRVSAPLNWVAVKELNLNYHIRDL